MRAALVLAVVALGACEDEPELLLAVDLRTDLVAGLDFDAVRVEVTTAGNPTAISQTTPLADDDGLAEGRRIAEFDGLAPARRRLRVILTRETAEVLDRWYAVEHDADLIVVAVLTRRCLDVTCDPSGLGERTCAGGRCVEPTCVDATCEDAECVADADCVAASECATARCAEGSCFQVADDSRCPTTGRCDVVGGCVPQTCSGTACDPVPLPAPGTVMIEELRTRGPGGAEDEFVEIRRTESVEDSIVGTVDGSAGWALVSSSGGVLRLLHVIPAGTTIPACAWYLVRGRDDSLGALGEADGTSRLPIPDDGGVALFASSDPAQWTVANRIDAVGVGPSTPDLLREGEPLPAYSFTGDAALVRRLVTATGFSSDTGDSRSDWLAVSPAAEPVPGIVTALGAPGPQGLRSPRRCVTAAFENVDSSVDGNTPPNRVSVPSEDPEWPVAVNSFRDVIVNTSPFTWRSLAFRFTMLSTLGHPIVDGGADVRVLDAPGGLVMLGDGTSVDVVGTTLVRPPEHPRGGGLNSAIRIPLPAAGLAPGARVAFEIRLGVATSGRFSGQGHVEVITD